MKDLIKKQKGFTIIEVLIVLAIAGLIILIVFLAVPALQRNSRNTSRRNDASQVASAVNECLTNKNGNPTSCDALGELQAVSLDTGKLQQLTTVSATTVAPTDPGAGVLNTVNVGFSAKCNATGDGLDPAGASTRSFALLYRVEVAGTGDAGTLQCVGS